MKRNKITIVIALLVSLLSMVVTVSANGQNDIKVFVDGNLIEFDVQPTIVNGRTLVPLRGIFENLGVEPVWNGETRTVTASNGNMAIVLPIGSKKVTVNNKQIELDVPATIIDGRTLVPGRIVAESFGAIVDWDGETRTVKINSNLKSVEGYREHSGEGGSEESGEGGDPSSPILTLDESWDGIVNGIRTAMSYDSTTGSFSGIVENTTNQTIKSILIELNLKKGTRTVVELGPQPVGDLKPGEQTTVELLVSDEPLAKGVVFDAWEIHPEAEGAGDGGESGSEESGNALTLNETYDVVRKGARLVMNYDKKSNSFKGIVENTTDNTLTKVRVEVHLSNGIELGPTTPIDIAPSEKADVILLATSKAFDGWTPHAEVGGNEHGAEGSSEGSEGSEGNERDGD